MVLKEKYFRLSCMRNVTKILIRCTIHTINIYHRKNSLQFIDNLNKVNQCKRETKVLVDFQKIGEFILSS